MILPAKSEEGTLSGTRIPSTPSWSAATALQHSSSGAQPAEALDPLFIMYFSKLPQCDSLAQHDGSSRDKVQTSCQNHEGSLARWEDSPPFLTCGDSCRHLVHGRVGPPSKWRGKRRDVFERRARIRR